MGGPGGPGGGPWVGWGPAWVRGWVGDCRLPPLVPFPAGRVGFGLVCGSLGLGLAWLWGSLGSGLCSASRVVCGGLARWLPRCPPVGLWLDPRRGGWVDSPRCFSLSLGRPSLPASDLPSPAPPFCHLGLCSWLLWFRAWAGVFLLGWRRALGGVGCLLSASPVGGLGAGTVQWFGRPFGVGLRRGLG